LPYIAKQDLDDSEILKLVLKEIAEAECLDLQIIFPTPHSHRSTSWDFVCTYKGWGDKRQPTRKILVLFTKGNFEEVGEDMRAFLAMIGKDLF
jgi:hypothetical protein